MSDVTTYPLPPARRGKGQTKMTAALRQAKALDLLLAGNSYAQIAAGAGYASPGAAYGACRRALDSVKVNNVDELRQIETARIEQLVRGLYPRAIKGDVRAVDQVRKLIESKARLLGLNAAIQVENVGQIDQEIIRLAVALTADPNPDGTFTITELEPELGDELEQGA